MTQPVAAGDVIDASNTSPVPCTKPWDAHLLRYDRRSRVLRAQVALAAGEPIGPTFLPPRARVLAGDRITIVARLGPVSVAREAVVLQSAGTGQHFFVRGEDGAIFAAPALAEGHR
jgi:hypothetical protein